MTIRKAIPGDELALAQLNGMVQALHVTARPDIFGPVSTPELAEWFRGVLRNENQRVWLAEMDGVPAGYLQAAIHERAAALFFAKSRWCEIDALGVVEEMRGRGVARGLVETAIGWARELGIERVSTQCWSFNAVAQGAFARLGFAPMTVRLERSIERPNVESGTPNFEVQRRMTQ
jgi:GNAT superfamily N-acetyltransferase